LVKLCRVGAEEAKQMPEKEEPGREGEKELIGHLGGEPSGIVHRCFPDQTPENSADEFEAFHLRSRVYFACHKYPLNSPAPAAERLA
jgi:hypothetical protein